MNVGVAACPFTVSNTYTFHCAHLVMQVVLGVPSGFGVQGPFWLGSCPGSITDRLFELPALSAPSQATDRKSTRLNSSHLVISYAVFCLKKKKEKNLSN